MFRKLLRSSLLITLLLIVSITLSGCSVDVSAIFAGIKTFIGNISGNLTQFVTNGISTVKNVIDSVKTVAKPIVDTAKSIFNNTVEKIDKVKGVIDTGRDIVKGVTGGIKDVIKTGTDMVVDVIDTGKNAVSDVVNAGRGIRDDIKGVRDDVKGVFKTGKDVAKGVKDAKGSLKDIGINIKEGARDAIGNPIKEVFKADKVASRDSEEPARGVSTITVGNTDTKEESNMSFTEWLRSLAQNHTSTIEVNSAGAIKDNEMPAQNTPRFVPTEEQLEVMTDREKSIVRDGIKSDAQNLQAAVDELIEELNKAELKDVGEDVKADVDRRLINVKNRLDKIIADPLNKDRVIDMDAAGEEIEGILIAAQGYAEELEDFSSNVETILDKCETSLDGIFDGFVKVFGEDI